MSADSLPKLTPADKLAEREYFDAIDLARADKDKAIEKAQQFYDLMCATATRVYLRKLDHE